MVLNGKDCQHSGENPNINSIMKVWKDYTIEDAIVIMEKAIKPKTIKFLREKTVSRCCA